MEKEAIEKWIEEYIENTIHITVDKKISLLDPRNGMLQEIYYGFILLLRVILE